MFGIETSEMMMMSGWVLYASIFVLPFVQEDAAVIGAAAASLSGAGPTGYIVMAILAGLVCSDAWKYLLGHMARSHAWAHRFAQKPGVSIAEKLVKNEFLQTMLTARFIPGTRIPTYIACGFFKAPYGKYVAVLTLTASLYIGVTFGLFHSLGAVIGEQAKFWLPAISITCLVAYIIFRWWGHRNQQKGPMTPLSREFDHDVSNEKKS